MIVAPAAQAKLITDLTCWKCGEETLEESSGDPNEITSRGERVVPSGLRHSKCSRCGAYSVSTIQARHNKRLNRNNRKAIIKEANRKLG